MRWLLLSQNMQTRNRKMPIPNQMAMHDKRNKNKWRKLWKMKTEP